MSATLYGLGVGPGDPELLTLKALRILRAAPVVAYPAPLDGESLARRIAAAHLPGGQTEVPVRLPFDPERGDTDARYDQAAALLCDHLGEGRNVAFLCLGDPLFYGTFANLCARIAPRFPVEVVPGVSSLSAAAAALRLPLGRQNEVIAVVPATLSEEDLAARIGGADSVAVIKLGRHLPKVRRVLARLGLASGARFVAQVGRESQRICALADLEGDEAPYFSLLLLRKDEAEP